MTLSLPSFPQPQKIGIIDVFGLEKIPAQTIREALPVKEGSDFDYTSFDKAAMQRRLLSIPGVKQAHISTICCDDKNGFWILFVGISENAVSGNTYNIPASGLVRLTEEIVQTYQQFDSLFFEAVQKGQASEADSLGYSLLLYPPAMPVQVKLIRLARDHVTLLKEVLHHSSDAKHRAIAAWMLAYTDNKQEIARLLVSAVKDPDEGVRNNAARCLAILGRYTAAHPGSKINFPVAPFIEMIQSIVWTDRNKGLAVLESLTRKRDTALFDLLANGSLPSLAEMAKWKNPGHAAFAFMIIGRMAGIADEIIFEALNRTDRTFVVDEYVSRIRKN